MAPPLAISNTRSIMLSGMPALRAFRLPSASARTLRHGQQGGVEGANARRRLAGAMQWVKGQRSRGRTHSSKASRMFSSGSGPSRATAFVIASAIVPVSMLCSQAAAAKQQQPKRPTQLDRLHHHAPAKSELPREPPEPKPKVLTFRSHADMAAVGHKRGSVEPRYY